MKINEEQSKKVMCLTSTLPFCIRMDVPFLLHELVYTKNIMEVDKSEKKGYNNVK